jgi:hypothetical protein
VKIQGSGQGALLLDNAAAAIDEILAGLGRQRGYAATITGTAAAANAAIAEVKNPAASGKTAYFYLGDLWVATAMSVSIVFDGTDITTISTPSPLFAGGGASGVLFGGGNQLGPTGTEWHTTPSLTANLAYSLPGWFWCALPPNHNLQFQGGVVNQAFTVNLRWFELSV